MRTLVCTTVIALIGASTAAGATDEPDSCRAFVLKRVAQEYTIEAVDLAENEMRVFPSSRDTGIVDVILPVGFGTSGSMAKWSDQRLLIVRCADGALTVAERVAGGKDWTRPARKLADLARFDVRVSVTGADGVRNAFLILANEQSVVETVGPVVDVFAGMIPTSEGDHTLCTDTYHHRLGPRVVGEVPLKYDRWPLVVARLADGNEGLFIADIGAGSTVVAKDFLPPGTTIEKASMVQYSSAGKKLLKYAPGGATGAVDTVLGHATLRELHLGSIRFDNPRIDVIEEMPDLFGQPIAGILGMDLMRRCGVLSMSLKDKRGASPTLRMRSSAEESGSDILELPFTFVSSHVIIDGKVNDSLVHFVMDTGAPGIILDAEAAKRLGVNTERTMRPGRGLDGGEADMRLGSPVDLSFADRSFGAVQPRISALACFMTLRTNRQNAGLLGNSFFSRFSRIELDFDRRTARFVN